MANAGLVFALAACAITPRAAEMEQGGVWSESVEIRADEMFVADNGRLEIRLVRVGVTDAILDVRASGYAQRIELRTGPLGNRVVGDYRIKLLTTTLEPGVQLQITRLR